MRELSKPFYADYVNRMLRFYCRKVHGQDFKVEGHIEINNCLCVIKVLETLPENDKNAIINIYERGDTLADNIYWVSKEMNVNQDMLWTLVSNVTKRIAKERGLI